MHSPLRRLLLPFALCGSMTVAQPAPPPSRSAPAPDIVVQGHSREKTRAFIKSMTTVSPRNQLARWNDPICVEARGLPVDRANFVLDRIEDNARAVKVPIGKKGCQANITILATTSADALLADIVKNHPTLGNRPNPDPSALGGSGTMARPEELKALLEPRAIRWFHASQTRYIGGFGSRLSLTSREESTLAVIVIDPARIAGPTWGQLADYITMISLAQPHVEADFSQDDSILALYDKGGLNPHAAPTMTRQDAYFLKALYQSGDSTYANLQQAAIAGRVHNAVKADQRDR